MNRAYRRYLAEKFSRKRWEQMQPSFRWTGGTASTYYIPTPIGVYRKKRAYTRRGCCRKCDRLYKEFRKQRENKAWRAEYGAMILEYGQGL